MKRTKNPAKEAEYRKRAADLVAQMTLHEKVSQMLSWAPAIERLGIPAYNWWSEGIHGVGRAGTATVFPQAIGMAAAFDEDMMEQVGNAVGVEARGKYNMCRAHGDRDIFKGLTVWAPNINIFRDPRWGRGMETYGEDPTAFSALGYDAVCILDEATEKAGSTDPEAVVAAMQELEYDGVTGHITFDENGDPIKDVAILKLEDGAVTLETKLAAE